MAIADSDFKQALGRWPSGVTVITASRNGHHHGMTASAFVSVSLNPKLVLVSLDVTTVTLTVIREVGAFAVNVLAQEQASVSSHFASKATERDRFAGIAHELGENGAPLVNGALAQLECQVYALHPAGDHVLVVGEVTRVVVSQGQPLLYFDRAYGRFSPQ